MFPSDRQPKHTDETVKLVEFELKNVLQDLAQYLFGSSIECRWVEAYFPFTHPSWELEIKTKIGYSEDGGTEEWIELLGCGVMRQEILERAGISNKVGYAFGLGLERWAMQLYQIPDIRLFWSKDEQFLNQFQVDDIHSPIRYEPISIFPPYILDVSFWIDNSYGDKHSQNPTCNIDSAGDEGGVGNDRVVGNNSTQYNVDESIIGHVDRDFCDIVRQLAGDLIEQVCIVDTYKHPTTGRVSLCYRLVYRDHHRTLTGDEILPLHDRILQEAVGKLNLSIR